MKKITILLLIMCICLSFGLLMSCGGGGGSSSDDPAEDDVNNYLCFTSTGKSTIWMTVFGTVNSLPALEYSKDKTTWEDFVIEDTTVYLENGEKVYFRGNNTSFSKDDVDYLNFGMTGSIAASGNIMSLLDESCKSVTLPGDYCFYCLFSNCDVLTAAPELPATNLTEGCYNSMFYGCTNLTTAPKLPATTLTPYCYDGMFANCTALTAAPELPATTLTPYCYDFMFSNCENLTAAPELPAETLVEYCYFGMFLNCINLNSITVYFTDWNTSDNSTGMWVYSVADSGTFRCPSALVPSPLTDTDFSEDKFPKETSHWNVETF